MKRLITLCAMALMLTCAAPVGADFTPPTPCDPVCLTQIADANAEYARITAAAIDNAAFARAYVPHEATRMGTQ